WVIFSFRCATPAELWSTVAALCLWSASGAGRCPKMYVARRDREPRTVGVADDQPTGGIDGFKNAAPDHTVLRDGDRRPQPGGGTAPAVEHRRNAAPVIPLGKG